MTSGTMLGRSVMGWSILFGVELELLITPKRGVEVKTWEDVTRKLSELLSEKTIKNEIFDNETTKNYNLWTIAGETLGQDRVTTWGVELISNICATEKKSFWKYDQEVLWQCVESHFDIVPTEACGTHVHASFNRRQGWGLRRLKDLAKAVVYFERCIDSLMQPYRLRNKHCRSNRYNPNFREVHEMKEIFQMIEEIEGRDAHSRLANLLSPDTRWYRWNFGHMDESKPNYRTVEFRQPPGSTGVEDAKFWAQFTLAFISAAYHWPRQIKAGKLATMAELREFIDLGSGSTKSVFTKDADRSYLDEFFKKSPKLPEGFYAEEHLTSEDLVQIHPKSRIECISDAKLQAWMDEMPVNEGSEGEN